MGMLGFIRFVSPLISVQWLISLAPNVPGYAVGWETYPQDNVGQTNACRKQYNNNRKKTQLPYSFSYVCKYILT